MYITQPNDVNGNNDDTLPTAGIQAVAESDSTLELLPVPPHVNNAKSQIRALLPTYSSTGHYQSKDLLSKERLFANVPFSDMECQVAFEYMACFELEDPAGCFIPSAQAKVQAWTTILEYASTFRLDLTIPLSVTEAVNIISDTTDLPKALIKAVRDAVSSQELFSKSTTTIIEEDCVTFVGLSQLEASTQGRGVTLKADFMSAWKDLLPEKWRGTASLTLLKDQYVLEGSSIAFAGSTADLRTAPYMAVPAAGTKRKWHDKFRASKKTA